ncbi:MAG: response regulator transcription factor [Tannerella sp.]|jgi:DNA-binding NarL/FixJ family response regulator|nr:response regulator transcription factor [Tannerella sp.]
MDNLINVILVDDHRMFRAGIKSLLSLHPDICVSGEADSGEELLELLKTQTPDVVLLDVIMPGIDGVETTQRIKRDFPETKILIVSSENQRGTINELVNLDIQGFITKQACNSSEELGQAIRSIASGLTYFGKDITQILYSVYVSRKEAGMPELTSRETEIIALCRSGLQSKEIANRLNIEPRTVETHKNNIFRKLGINNTVEMVQYAIKAGIIRVD